MVPALTLVALSLAVLAAAPFVAMLLVRRPALVALLDSFVLVAVGGIVALDVIPQSMEHAGVAALAVAGVGLFVPIALHGIDERLRSRSGRTARNVVLLLALLAGTAVHALFDGVALAGAALQPSLALGVLLHRLPVGLALWVMVRPRLGLRGMLLVVAALLVGTVAGAIVGEAGLPSASVPGLALVQAFIAGSILHIVAETPPIAVPGTTPSSKLLGLVGAGLAAAAVFLLHRLHGLAPDEAHAGVDAGDTFVALALRVSPAVLLSFLLVGSLSALYAPGVPRFPASRGRLFDAASGVFTGLPHPLCSCTVAPLYASLVQRGTSPAAARAFLVATPELGVPALLLSARVVGLPFVLARVICAALVAWLVGLSVDGRTEDGDLQRVTHDEKGNAPDPLRARLLHGMRHALLDAVDHVGPWLILGLGVASMLERSLEVGALASASPALQTMFFAIAAFPLYLCAAGSTPVAAVLLHKGAAVGAVLALLLVGPATSLSTLALLRRLHGRRVALLFALFLGASATAAGLLVNSFRSSLTLIDPLSLELEMSQPTTTLEMASLSALLVLFLISLARQGVRGFLVQIMSPQHEHHDAHDHVHGPGCFHDHGPPVAPQIPGSGIGRGSGSGTSSKHVARVHLSFDPRVPRMPSKDEL